MDSESQAKFTLLEQANGELTLQLTSTIEVCEELRRKYAAEAEEAKNLKMTLALRAEYDREAGTKDWQIEALQEQNHLLETTNTNLLSTLADTRTQLSTIFHESAQKSKTLKDLQDEILELEEKGRLMKYTEGDVMYIGKMYEEETAQVRKEMECLKAQKEDIVNHSQNSEKAWQEKLEALQREIKRLHEASNSSPNVEDSLPESKEKSMKISELTLKLKDALEAIDELEEENSMLREKLEEYNEQKMKLESDVESQKKFLTEETKSYTEDCEKYEVQIANLNEEMTKIEELHVRCQAELKRSKEKQVKLQITFANDRARFCHDMECTEERWNAEVVTLTKANEKLEKLVANSNQQAEENAKNLEKIEEMKVEIQQLTEKLNDSKLTHETALGEWDEECSGLETELYKLMDKRKTEKKRLHTIQRKYQWLQDSTRTLSIQRRTEIDNLNKEIQTLQDRCDLLKKEKVEWLSDLKKDVNAWKDEVSVREGLQSRIEELEKHVLEDEERIETITEKWREECLEYQESVSQIQQLLNQKKTDEKLMMDHINAADVYVTKVEKKCQEKEEEAENLQKTCDKLMDEKKRLEEKFESMVSKTSDELEELQLIHEADRRKLAIAHKRNRVWQNINDDLVAKRENDRLMIGDLREKVARLGEDMGVEELDDEVDEVEVPHQLETSSCSSSSSESDVNAYSTHSESDFEDDDHLYDDMPKLDKAVEEAPKKEGWEMV